MSLINPDEGHWSNESDQAPHNLSSILFSLDLLSSHNPNNDYPGRYALNGVCIPLIGLCGVLGNILNLAILTWRYYQRQTDVLERSALLGLIGLAVSDLSFCITILPHALYYTPKTLFASRSFHYYYKTYAIYIQNVFIKTSTSLTVVVATARYVAICHPLQARVFAGLLGTKIAVIGTFVLWGGLCLPLLWTYHISTFPLSPNQTYYLLDLGWFPEHQSVYVAFTYVWSVLGYFLPVALLTYCNMNLIRALRESRRMREKSAPATHSRKDSSVRINITLVGLIIMFTVLVSPSEILHFYSEVVEKSSYRSFQIAMNATNILQALNFAFHFVLYCVTNVTFRRTVMLVLNRVLRKVGLAHLQVTRYSAMSMTHAPRTSVSGVVYTRNAQKQNGGPRIQEAYL